MKRRFPRGTQPSSLKRASAAVAVAAAGTVALSGCFYASPQQTDNAYQSADGIDVFLGDVTVSNLVVVSAAKGQPGTVTGRVVNGGGQPVSLSISGPGGSPIKTEVPAHGTAELAGPGVSSPVVLSAVAEPPGAMVQLQVSTPTEGATQVKVPVLLPNGYYQTLAPTGAPTSP